MSNQPTDYPEAETGKSTGTVVDAARAVDLHKQYGEGETAVVALDHINIEFARNQFTAIMGDRKSVV